ncbi:MAG: hypothetical protein ACOC95_05445 [Planctomycetota bacterium]
MLRTPLNSKVGGRTLDFSTGDPTKDKLLMAGLVVVIIVAIAFMAWSLTGGKEKTLAERVITKDVALICINPECSYETQMNRQDYYQKLEDELTFEERHGMTPVRTMCPECNHPGKTVVQGVVCPNCKKAFVNPEALFNASRALGFPAKRPTSPRLICPHCDTDIQKYWAEERNKDK